MALPLGELSPQATERVKAVCRFYRSRLFTLSVLAALMSPEGEARGLARYAKMERQGMPAE